LKNSKGKTPVFLYNCTDDNNVSTKSAKITYELLKSEIYTGQYASNFELICESGAGDKMNKKIITRMKDWIDKR